MKRVLVPIGVLIALLLISIAAERLLGGERPWLNVIRHLSLGGTAAWGFAEVWRWASTGSFVIVPVWFRSITLIAGAILLGVLWEFLEWQFDLVVTRTDVGNPYDDTIGDLRMNIVGAILAVPFFWRIKDR